ncbi:MAG: hypothetical protein AAF770_00565 [Bacteroidota bacterium]
MTSKEINNQRKNSSHKNLSIANIAAGIAMISLALNIYLMRNKQPRVMFYNQDEIIANIISEAEKQARSYTEGMGKELLYIKKKVEDDQKLLQKENVRKSKVEARIKRNSQVFYSKLEVYKRSYNEVATKAKIKLMKDFERTVKNIKEKEGYRSIIGVGGIPDMIHEKDHLTNEILLRIGIEKKKKTDKQATSEEKETSSNQENSKEGERAK